MAQKKDGMRMALGLALGRSMTPADVDSRLETHCEATAWTSRLTASEQSFGVLDIGCIGTLGEAIVDLRESSARLIPMAPTAE